MLGDHHNLALLRAMLRQRPRAERDGPALAGLTARIDARLAALADDAFAQATPILADKPSALLKRLKRGWARPKAPRSAIRDKG